MELLTIGAFARASGLSQKALRLYDALGLLPPARVDPVSGYRFYAPAQLERARLVAWLRRLGMPLARVRELGAMAGPVAAREVGAYWAAVEEDVAARRDLAAFLADRLAGACGLPAPHGGPVAGAEADTGEGEGEDGPALVLHSAAALSSAGPARDGNKDAAHAGSRVLAVADGFGDDGASASAAAVAALRQLDADGTPEGPLLAALDDAVAEADRAVRAVAAGRGRAPGTSGTTLTALLWAGPRLGVVHVGDCRVYVQRAQELRQVTRDHTLVQALVDEGRLTPAEAAAHPRRTLLLRALTGADGGRPDLRVWQARAGDRYLLCSDGLTCAVPAEEVGRALAAAGEPGQAVRELVALAREAGGGDDVSCVVADVGEAA